MNPEMSREGVAPSSVEIRYIELSMVNANVASTG
jgi:hypothetical protein